MFSLYLLPVIGLTTWIIFVFYKYYPPNSETVIQHQASVPVTLRSSHTEPPTVDTPTIED